MNINLGGPAEWLSIMEPWQFWLLMGFGAFVVIVNAVIFIMCPPPCGKVHTYEEDAREEEGRARKRELKARRKETGEVEKL